MKYKERVRIQKTIVDLFARDIVISLDHILDNQLRSKLLEWYCATRMIDTSQWKGLE